MCVCCVSLCFRCGCAYSPDLAVCACACVCKCVSVCVSIDMHGLSMRGLLLWLQGLKAMTQRKQQERQADVNSKQEQMGALAKVRSGMGLCVCVIGFVVASVVNL